MKHHLNKIKNSPLIIRQFLIVAIILLLVGIFYEFGIKLPKVEFGNKNESVDNSEIETIKGSRDLKAQSELYKKLILRVGPEQAQDDLLRSGMPFDGQTHLLNHVVGDFIYEKYGTEGLPRCKDYFLSSCYHGFILNAIADKGMQGVSESFKECLKFGHSVSSQCAHAIGHGFLANAGYKNLPKALETCDEAVATMPQFPAFNCYDGVFMENIWAVHDDGLPSPDRWVKQEDPFYPCNDPSIDEKYLSGCWSNQPSLAYQLFRGDIKKVGTDVCDKIVDKSLKEMCFNGLARQIHPITQGSEDMTLELCNLMPAKEWVNYCIVTIAGAGYSVGDRETPYKTCALTDEQAKENCYGVIFGQMRNYQKEGEDNKKLCEKITESKWKTKCEEMF